MTASPGRRAIGRHAFTLVELLVVIGIIALLISILLPALNKARRSANQLKCSSNMKQIAMAVMQYAQANRGKLIPCQIRAGLDLGTPDATLYPTGWWFASELVRLKHLNAPNMFPDAGGPAQFHGSSVFRCPEGIDETDLVGSNGGKFPADGKNNGYTIANVGHAQTEGFGVASWYMLNSTISQSTAKAPAGSESAPFLYYNATSSGGQMRGMLNDPGFQRNLSMVKRSAEVVMLIEAADSNWYNNSGPIDPSLKINRLGARHGKKTADGWNAFMNLAFFDGHVATVASAPVAKIGPKAYTSDTIFVLSKIGR